MVKFGRIRLRQSFDMTGPGYPLQSCGGFYDHYKQEPLKS
jgi:hypothetical protein